MNSQQGVLMSMEPIGIDVRYVDAGSGDICSEERESFAPFSDEAISVDASFEAGVLEYGFHQIARGRLSL